MINNYFDTIQLRPLSLTILQYIHSINNKDELTSQTIAEHLGFKKVAVDAAITKSLIRYGFVIREGVLSPLKKKLYTIIKITPQGIKYLNYLKEKENGSSNTSSNGIL